MVAREAPQLATRFDRDAWLRTAIDVLAEEGQAKLRVERIAKALGVTKGSFYHHFESREAFVHRLLAFWSETFTASVMAEVSALDAPADQRLLALMRIIEKEGLDRYDIAFRSWAAQDPAVAEEVRKVDLARYAFVRELFAEMGFDGADLNERLRLWLVFQSAKRTVFVPEDGADSDAAIERRHAFFTRR
jgi:AcrR family transcriptional regulator